MAIHTISDLFLNYSKATAPALPLEEERALIMRAASRDDKAQMQLLEQYAPGIRSAFARITQPLRHSLSREDIEDLQMEAVMGFYAAVDRAADDEEGDTRVAKYLASEVALALRDHQAVRIAVTVPARTLRRYNAIMAQADNDLTVATRLALEYDMRPDTLMSVYEAVNQRGHVQLDRPASRDGQGGYTGTTGSESVGDRLFSLEPAVEDAVETIRLAQQARAAVEGRELDVIDRLYGFDELDEARSEREVAGELGLSKTTVHRTHHSALSNMRSAIGLA